MWNQGKGQKPQSGADAVQRPCLFNKGLTKKKKKYYYDNKTIFFGSFLFFFFLQFVLEKPKNELNPTKMNTITI